MFFLKQRECFIGSGGWTSLRTCPAILIKRKFDNDDDNDDDGDDNEDDDDNDDDDDDDDYWGLVG